MPVLIPQNDEPPKRWFHINGGGASRQMLQTAQTKPNLTPILAGRYFDPMAD